MKYSTSIGLLLLMSSAFLISLVPGGPIETRDFSHIQPWVLLSFNVYLTVVGISSMVWGVHALRKSLNPLWSLLSGLSYLIIYGLDLLTLFPVSPTPMNQALWSIEITGLLLSLPLIALSCWQLMSANAAPPRIKMVNGWPIVLLIGAVVVAYATYSAMSGLQGI
ncbi:hypothetical protein Q4488_10045 [Amphritea sp. 1_MG-2023]|uniref:hypothetical protein n=1 Tax=Amphritea sp. 1_MG-2023 TaxID=3062670 RepID=UPI0026E1C8D0|nr:hypothetical protein [Amphritea sp. 1_MG-2023]MDO6563726.1 hypothetical protein [Amphritea sp. 1_MG-2023]